MEECLCHRTMHTCFRNVKPSASCARSFKPMMDSLEFLQQPALMDWYPQNEACKRVLMRTRYTAGTSVMTSLHHVALVKQHNVLKIWEGVNSPSAQSTLTTQVVSPTALLRRVCWILETAFAMGSRCRCIWMVSQALATQNFSVWYFCSNQPYLTPQENTQLLLFVPLCLALLLNSLCIYAESSPKSTNKGLRYKVSMVTLYSAQVTLGYLAMLIAMTYAIVLFIMVVLGLTIGHALFNMGATVTENRDPCCPGDIEADMINEKAKILYSDDNTSSGTDEEAEKGQGPSI
mmetsp:Transcript_19798/g.24144  ORF Transcript_19798/g.24144 Transcript_19798/m.24144 type:complete len:290 (-) Transcript_19798:1649-2518(-)